MSTGLKERGELKFVMTSCPCIINVNSEDQKTTFK